MNQPILKSLKYQKQHLDSLSVFSQIDSLKIHFEKIGFFNNKLDTIVKKDTVFNAHFILGKSNKLIRIYYNNNSIDKKTLFQISSKIKDTYFEIPIDKISETLNRLAILFESKGNSFTKIRLSEIILKKNSVTATLNIEKSNQRTIDRVIIKGIENFPKTFIKHLLNIKSETIFSRKKVLEISNQIKILPFVSEIKPAEVLFTKDSTYLYLYLQKKKANRFDGLIGFASDKNTNALKFNGYLDLVLTNTFNSGEAISLNWRNSGDNKQHFNFNVAIPYIFNSAITPKISLNIYKQDSTFVNTKANLELGYDLNHKNKISLAIISETSTSLLNNPINSITDYTRGFYGATYTYKVLNNAVLFNTKFRFNIGGFFGNRKSNGINTKQSLFNLSTNYLWSLNFKNHIYLKNKSSVLISDTVLANELFRIGGVNSIRGFNEESIFASLYSTFNIEYRYSVNNSSYLYSISDIGYTRNQLTDQSQEIYSLGLGYAFSTNFGFLNLSYALGKVNNISFDLDNSRFHIKIINYF